MKRLFQFTLALLGAALIALVWVYTDEYVRPYRKIEVKGI